MGRSTSSVQTSLPLATVFPDGEYISSKAFLRSAIFGVEKKGRRQVFRDEPLASRDGLRIRFTGEGLDQFDHDVWMVLVRVAREHGLGLNVNFSLRSFLSELEWGEGKKANTRLRSVFKRLGEATIYIESDKFHFQGHLVDEVLTTKAPLGDASGEESYYFRLSPKMAGFLSGDNVSYLAIRDRLQVKGMLAKWLHGFIESDPRAFPVKIDDLWSLSRSSCKERYQFLRALRKAFTELERCGIIESWKVDAVYAFVTPSVARQAQRRAHAAAQLTAAQS
jgi:hypothetical protein